jgi:hypothetical protein
MPWIDLPPCRETKYAGALGDITSRVPANYPDYSDPDEVTFGHESSHGVSARIRNEHRTANGFYCLNNRAYVCDSPAFTLKQLADRIPESIRRQVFKLYLIDQQRHWNETPLYVCEEMVCYTLGCRVGLERELAKRTLDSLDRAMELYEYCRVAQAMMRETNYLQQDDFDSFLAEFYHEGLGSVIRECTAKGWL